MTPPLLNTFWGSSNGGIEVNRFRYLSKFRTPPHVHEEYAIVALIEGASGYTQLGLCERLHRGDFLVTNGAVFHSSVHAVGGDRTEGVALTFSRSLFQDCLRRVGVDLIHPVRQFVLIGKVSLPTALPLVEAIVQEGVESRPGSTVVIEGLAMALALQVLRAWPRTLIREREASTLECMTRQQLIRTLEFMTATPRDAFSVPALCAALQVSRAELYASFATTMGGTTPAACYNMLMMDRANALLLDRRQLSVKQVAFELGFRDVSHFVANFRRARGITPSAARSAANPPEQSGSDVSNG